MTKKGKYISELSNEELKQISIITSDSILLSDAIFDSSDEEAEAEKESMYRFLNELNEERKKRRKTKKK